MPDPKLKEIAEEIKTILRKHDVGAVVLLNSPTHGEFVYELCPTWSCARLEETPKGLAIRVKSKHVDYPSKEAQLKELERTAGMFMSLLHMLNHATEAVTHLVVGMSEKMEIQHTSVRE